MFDTRGASAPPVHALLQVKEAADRLQEKIQLLQPEVRLREKIQKLLRRTRLLLKTEVASDNRTTRHPIRTGWVTG